MINNLPTQTQPSEDAPPPAEGDPRSPALTVEGRMDQVVNALERELRAGTVDPNLLQELGWNAAKAREFVEAYRRVRPRGPLRDPTRSAVTARQRTTSAPASDLTVLQGSATPGGARTFESATPSPADRMKGAADPARQRVPDRYRATLEAYYRSITSQPRP